MNIEVIERRINIYIDNKIGDEVHNVKVRIIKPEEMPLTPAGYVLMGDGEYYAVVTTCYMHTNEITVIKPATRLDMIKAGLPYFIQRIFPPKRIEESITVGVPGTNAFLPKQKLGVYGRFTEEMLDNQDVLIEFIGDAAVNAIRARYKYVTVRL